MTLTATLLLFFFAVTSVAEIRRTSTISNTTTNSDSILTNYLNRRQQKECPPARKPCGSGENTACVPKDSICCSQSLATFCYPGERCDTTNGVISCVGRSVVTNGNCSGTLYQACGRECIPRSYSCCNQNTGYFCIAGETCRSTGDFCCFYGICGNSCLEKPEHTCCNGVSCGGTCSNNVCCPEDNFVCGGTCVSKGLVCCNEKVCSSDQKCFSGTCVSATSPSPNLLIASPPPEAANSTPIIVGSVVGIIALIALSVFAFFFIRKRNAKKESISARPVSSIQLSDFTPQPPQYFDYNTVPKDENGNPIYPRDEYTGLYNPNRASFGDSNDATGGSVPSVPPSAVYPETVLPEYVSAVPGTSAHTGVESFLAKRHTITETENLFMPAAEKWNAVGCTNFTPNEKDEEEIQLGDQVVVAAVFRDGWALGFNTRTQRRGVFPVSAVIINDATDIQYPTS